MLYVYRSGLILYLLAFLYAEPVRAWVRDRSDRPPA